MTLRAFIIIGLLVILAGLAIGLRGADIPKPNGAPKPLTAEQKAQVWKSWSAVQEARAARGEAQMSLEKARLNEQKIQNEHQELLKGMIEKEIKPGWRLSETLEWVEEKPEPKAEAKK